MLKYIKFFLLSIILLVLLYGIYSFYRSGSSESENPSLPTTEEGLRELEVSYLRAGIVSDEIIPYALIEVPEIRNIGTWSDSSGTYIISSLFPDQPLKSWGIRSEISIDYPYIPWDTIEYSWKFFMPEDFVSDTPLNRWWVLADWHDQPDRTKNQTWDDYPGNSAPIIIGYGNKDNTDMLSLSTWIANTEKGIEPRWLIPFEKGKWNSMRLVIHWSEGEDGIVELYFNDSNNPTIQTKGPNMLNSFQHYFKVGQYRHPEISTENHIFLRDISIKKLSIQ